MTQTTAKTQDPVIDTAEALDAATAALEQARAQYEAAQLAKRQAEAEAERRREAEEDRRVAEMAANLEISIEGAEYELNRFRLAVIEHCNTAKHSMGHLVSLWTVAARWREQARRQITLINKHRTERSAEFYAKWEEKVDGWWNSIQAVVGRRHNGLREDDETDWDALAEVNERINRESAEAPYQLNRDPKDMSIPGPEELGIPRPTTSGFDQKHDPMSYLPLTFTDELNRAINAAVQQQLEGAYPGVSLNTANSLNVSNLEAAIAASEATLHPLILEQRVRDASKDTRATSDEAQDA